MHVDVDQVCVLRQCKLLHHAAIVALTLGVLGLICPATQSYLDFLQSDYARGSRGCDQLPTGSVMGMDLMADDDTWNCHSPMMGIEFDEGSKEVGTDVSDGTEAICDQVTCYDKQGNPSMQNTDDFEDELSPEQEIGRKIRMEANSDTLQNTDEVVPVVPIGADTMESMKRTEKVRGGDMVERNMVLPAQLPVSD